jgi:hypothetical protein
MTMHDRQGVPEVVAKRAADVPVVMVERPAAHAGAGDGGPLRRRLAGGHGGFLERGASDARPQYRLAKTGGATLAGSAPAVASPGCVVVGSAGNLGRKPMKQEITPSVPKHENAKIALEKELDARLAEFTRKRGRDKLKAFSLRIAAVVFGATITVLVGLRAGTTLDGPLKNVVLVLGALTVIANAWDGFYDHRGLWIKRTITVSRLKRLKRDLDFEVAMKGAGDLAPGELRALKARLDQVLEDDVNNWIQLRDEVKEEKGRKEPKAHAGETNGERHDEGGRAGAAT